MSESGRWRGQVGLEATVRHSVILRDENPLWGFWSTSVVRSVWLRVENGSQGGEMKAWVLGC